MAHTGGKPRGGPNPTTQRATSTLSRGNPKPEPASETGGPERTLAEIVEQEAKEDSRHFAFVLQELAEAIEAGAVDVSAVLGVTPGDKWAQRRTLDHRLMEIRHDLHEQDEGFAQHEAKTIAIRKEAHDRYRKRLGKAPLPESFWRGHEATPGRRRGPSPGAVDRYGDEDRALFGDLENLMSQGMSISAAARKLAEENYVAGHGTKESTARRLARRYRKEANRGS